MQRTYDVPAVRAGLVAILAALLLLALPGTSIAGGASEPARTSPAANADLLQFGAGYGKATGARQVRALQRELRALGWQPGDVDGLFGPRTERAVTRFQYAARVAVDGIVGPHTRRALDRARTAPLRRGAGYAHPAGSPRVRVLQRKLRRNGLRPGPVDGLYGPRTEAAVFRLERSRGLPQDGVADARTRRALDTGADRPGGEPSRPVDRPQAPVDPTTPATIQMTRSEPSEGGLEWLVVVALMALGLGALAGLLVGRLRAVPSTQAVALARGVVAEGKARAASIGRFRGQVHALVLGRRGLRHTEDARYLLSDPRKPVPFWVQQQEVARLIEPAEAEEAHPYESGEKEAPQSAAQDPRPVPTPTSEPVRALGYVSVESNGEPDADAMPRQAEAIDSLCERRGWQLVEVVRDVEGAGGGALRRPGLSYAVGRIAKGEASCLVVSELGRLSNSASELGRVLELLAHSGARLVVMDIGLDTATEGGRVAAKSLIDVGSWERRRVLESTRKGLAAARARRVATGRTAVEDMPGLKRRIVDMRREGMTLQAIADELNDEGVPTLRGGQKWRPSSVQAALGYRRPSRRSPGPENGGGGEGANSSW